MNRDDGCLNRVAPPLWINCLSSHLASLTAITICYPLDCIKTRLQVMVTFIYIYIFNYTSVGHY